MQSPFRWNEFLPLGVVVTILALTTFTISAVAENAAAQPEMGGKSSRLSPVYGNVPISFEVNQGQADASVQFLARGLGYTLFLTPGEAVLSLSAPHGKAAKVGRLAFPTRLPSSSGESVPSKASSTIRLQLVGANTAAEARGVDALPGKSNYLIGEDTAAWRMNVPTYAKVRYRNVYPGIDLMYYGNQEGRLEHDFVVAPGANPAAIEIGLSVSDGVVPDQSGGLILRTESGDINLRRPIAYQMIGGKRRTVSATYLLARDNQIKFELGEYDKSARLVIDPVIEQSISIEGNSATLAYAIAVDGAGSAYVTGFTLCTDFPTLHAFQPTRTGDGEITFVTKFNPAGTAVVYSTYLGGNNSSGQGIAVDGGGRAYVVGRTTGGLPVKNAYQSSYGGGDADAFFAILGAGGDTLAYSTYLGGSDYDTGVSLVLDASGNAYVTGRSGVGFPTLHSMQTEGDAFVAKFDRTGVLQYSSLIGVGLQSFSIALDSHGSIYVAGGAFAPGLTTTDGAFRSQCTPGIFNCGFVVKVSQAGQGLKYEYATYFPGVVEGLAVDSSGSAYVGGLTDPGFPAHKSGLQYTFGGGTADGFVSKLNPTGTGLTWSTYLGGTDEDVILGLALDRYRQVYVTGYTGSPNFPTKASWDSCPIRNGVGTPGFVTTLSGSLGSIVYYSSCSFTSLSFGIAVDKALNVYLPSNFGYSIFVTKLVIMDDVALGLSGTPSPVVHGGNLTYTIAVTSKGPDFGYNVRVADTLPAGTTLVSYGAGGGKCTAPAVGGTGTLNCTLPQLAKGATWNVTLTVNVNAASGTNLSNTAAAISNMQDFVPANNSGTLTTHVN